MKENIGLLLKKRAEISSNQEAFVEVERQRRFTFSQLNARSNRVANTLLGQGIKPGDRVATLLKNGIEFLETYFAIAKIGAIMVPINWRLVADEIAYILTDSGACALVYDAEFDAAVHALQGGYAGIAIQYWLRNNAGLVERGDCPGFAADYDSVTVGASSDEPPVGAWDDDLLFIMYTSGTTGHPKGAMHTHEGMLWAQLTSLTTSDMRFSDRYLLQLPIFHVSCLASASQLVHRGATGVIMRDVDIALMFKTIEAEKITNFVTVPAILQFMLLAPEREQHDMSSVRLIATGGAPIPVSLLQQYQELGISIWQAYGLTESCGPGTILCPHDAVAKMGFCGYPQMHTAIRVIDNEGNPVVPGSNQVGELLLAGRHMMKGYWNKPEATAEALRDGWLHTGDLVTIDADGCIAICGRKKDMVISGGENIYPAELENVLAGCPEVLEAAVIGIPSEKWGETPLAIVVPAPGTNPTPESLLAYCREHMAAYKVPRLYELVESLPRNASGKLLKAQLRTKYPGPAPF